MRLRGATTRGGMSEGGTGLGSGDRGRVRRRVRRRVRVLGRLRG